MLDALGNLGDLIGGIGVIISLLYLAVQIRKNTAAQNANARGAVVESIHRINELVAGNRENAQVMLSGSMNLGALDPTDRLRFHLMARNMFAWGQDAWLSRRSGVLESDVYDFWEHIGLDLLRLAGFREWWEQNERDFVPAYREYIRGVLSDLNE